MCAFPSTVTAANGNGILSAELLRRLDQRSQRANVDLVRDGAGDLALAHEVAIASGTNISTLLSQGPDPPEVWARRYLDGTCSTLMSFGSLKDMARETELQERLEQRSQREGYDPKSHGPEDIAIALEYSAANNMTSPISNSQTPEEQASVAKRFLDAANVPLPTPDEFLPRYFEFTNNIRNFQSAFQSSTVQASDGMPRETLEAIQGIQSLFNDNLRALDALGQQLTDFQRLYNIFHGSNMANVSASFAQPNPEIWIQAFWPLLNEMASVIESIHVPRVEGSLLPDFRRTVRQKTEQVIENHRTRFPNGILPLVPRGQTKVTDEMLAEAMRREFFLGELPQVELYHELKSASSIRLLQHDGLDGAGRLKFILKEVELEAKAEFAAFSYVWGDPRTDLYQQYSIPKRSRNCEVICNGHIVLISVNLHDALKVIFTETLEGQSPLFDVEGERVWIDQLCINQDNVTEKSKQVAFMDNIYKEAKKVIAWVGPHDLHTDEALDVLKKVSWIQDATCQTPTHNVVCAMNQFSTSELISLSAFLSRPYFQRVWIVQELVFAKEIEMLCGKHRVPWVDLVNASTFIQTTGAWALLAMHATTFQESLSSQDISDEYTPREVRLGVSIQWQIRSQVTGSTHRSEPASLLMMSRGLQATDIRDKFYAMIGLAKDCAKRRGIPFELPLPDYSKSLETVTKEFTSAYIRSSNSLDILAMIEDPSYRKLRALPSWIPDYSVTLHPPPFRGNDTVSRNWTAGGDKYLGFETDREISVLRVEARWVANVTGVTPAFNEIQESRDWSSILKMTSGLFEDSTQTSIPPDEQLVRVVTCNSPDQAFDEERRQQLKQCFSSWMISNTHSFGALVDPILFNAEVLLSSSRIAELNALSTLEEREIDIDALCVQGLSFLGSARRRANDRKNLWGNSTRVSNVMLDAMTALWKANPQGFFPNPEFIHDTIKILRSRTEEAKVRQEEIANLSHIHLAEILEARTMVMSWRAPPHAIRVRRTSPLHPFCPSSVESLSIGEVINYKLFGLLFTF